MGYLICKKCGGYYELQEGESAEDFESCQCGGQLVFSDTEQLSESAPLKSDISENKREGETGKIKTCPNCGSEISEYSIICRVCGEKIELDWEDEPFEEESVDDQSKGYEKEESIAGSIKQPYINQPTTQLTEESILPEEQPPLEDISNKTLPQEIEHQTSDNKSLGNKKTIFCPYCGKKNDFDTDRCKYCQKEINIEKLKLKTEIPQETPEEHELYACPYCGAAISKHSIVCRSCGKSLDSPEKVSGSETSVITCSHCGKKEMDPTAEYCKSCGNPLRTSKNKQEHYSDDYLEMLSSKSFLMYLAVSIVLPAIIGFIVSSQNIGLIFIIVGMGFSFSYRSNIVNCMLGGLLLGITGYLSELLFHSLWVSSFNLGGELTLLFIFAAFGLIGGLIGNQLIERGIVV